MNLDKDKYIIVEVIPTHSKSSNGFIAQISALKIDNLKLIDRFDYRVEDHFIENDQLRELIQYDKKSFTYVDNIYFIIEKFKQWVRDYPLLLLEGNYTTDYLKEIPNKKELVYKYLDLEYNDEVFNKLIDKYKLAPSDHLVDLVYEAIIFESNNN